MPEAKRAAARSLARPLSRGTVYSFAIFAIKPLRDVQPVSREGYIWSVLLTLMASRMLQLDARNLCRDQDWS